MWSGHSCPQPLTLLLVLLLLLLLVLLLILVVVLLLLLLRGPRPPRHRTIKINPPSQKRRTRGSASVCVWSGRSCPQPLKLIVVLLVLLVLHLVLFLVLFSVLL